jgi:hypothetical protein
MEVMERGVEGGGGRKKKSDDPRFAVRTNSPLNYGGITALRQLQKGHS